SRRRHTRSDRDWSSDVCSSDLDLTPSPTTLPTWTTGHTGTSGSALHFDGAGSYVALAAATTAPLLGSSSLSFWIKTTQTGNTNRSEERRVGKECRTRWWSGD